MMKKYFHSLALFALMGLFLFSPRQTLVADSATIPAATQTGAYQVETVEYDWVDAKRDRKVPVKIYYPKNAPVTLPIIIFSHGLGGSREGYGYLGRYWASHGYVSVHVQHIGSDDAVWRDVKPSERMDAMQKSKDKAENILNRPLDINFAIDEITKMNTDDSPLKGKLNLNEIGVAGHSFGAYTTMAIAGQLYVTPFGTDVCKPDPRVKAIIAMSTPAPRKNVDPDRAFSRVTIPCFHMTGTLDDSPIGETKPIERRIPFDHTKGVDEFLVTFTGGDHMIFSGRMTGRRDKDAEFQKPICAASTAFWDAYLKGDATAKTWLAGNGFETLLGKEGVFEKKLR